MTIGTTAEVIDAFVFPNDPDVNRVTRTATAWAGGAQSRVSRDEDTLYSYRTAQARRLNDHAVAVWIGSGLTVTTSKMLSHLRGALMSAGYRPTAERYDVTWSVPGRWGGAGPAWHRTGYETTPFEVWEDSADARLAYADAQWQAEAARDAKAAAKAARKAAKIADQMTLADQYRAKSAERRAAYAADPATNLDPDWGAGL